MTVAFCSSCGGQLLYSARISGTGKCGPCQRKLPVTAMHVMLDPNTLLLTPEVGIQVVDLQSPGAVTEIAAGIDRGEGRFAQQPLCCERIGNGVWCNLPLKHKGDHDGPAPHYGPVRDPEKKFYTPPRVVVGGIVIAAGLGAWRDEPGVRATASEGGYVNPEDSK